MRNVEKLMDKHLHRNPNFLKFDQLMNQNRPQNFYNLVKLCIIINDQVLHKKYCNM